MANRTLEQLNDERDIVRALSQFARILDTKDWPRLREVFDVDVSFDYGGGQVGQGLGALTDNMRKYLDLCGGTQHLVGSLLVDVDDDLATSRAYVQARHQRRGDAGGPIFDSTGEYIDRWARRPNGWRIVRRDAHWFAQFGDAAIIGFGA
ncbi:MAG TPA: nuclear transport factor 2 family protein [Nevskiaceae bacterium]|nr:nuclear transport factor 2 family protein [Nevskiaceae bacterium]